MTASRTARERVRAELTREIADIARRQLATDGAGGLSLRAVAREMGMVSSAVYRYFPSRDDLLTALIIDGYNALGEAVELADAGCPRPEFAGRWLAVCHAVRDWALAHPHEYALLYGSPVPGYHAPEETIAARIRDVTVFGRIVSEAGAAGALAPPDLGVAPPPSLAADAGNLRQIMPGATDAVVFRAMSAWTGLYGWINFEVFGQFENTIAERHDAFTLQAHTLGALIGLTPG